MSEVRTSKAREGSFSGLIHKISATSYVVSDQLEKLEEIHSSRYNLKLDIDTFNLQLARG